MYNLKKAVSLMLSKEYIKVNQWEIKLFDLKQAERNPLLIKVKQRRKQLNNKS